MARAYDSLTRRSLDVRALANYVLDYADARHWALSNMAINKLVYFLCEESIVQRGIALTNAKVEAWEHGPVFRELYASFKHYGDKSVTERAKQFDPSSGFTKTAEVVLRNGDRQFVDVVLSEYVGLTAAQLRNISHAPGGAWDQVWNHAGAINPGMQITEAEIIESRGRSASVMSDPSNLVAKLRRPPAGAELGAL